MRRSGLPDVQTSRRRGYLDRLLETGTTRQPGAARVPHQIHWAPQAGPGASARPQPRDGEVDWPSTRPATAVTGASLTGPAAAGRRPHPSPLGLPPQEQVSDVPSAGPPPTSRDAAGVWPRVPTGGTAARALLRATSIRLESPVLARAGQGNPTSEAVHIPATPTHTTPVIPGENGRTRPPGAPSVHIGSIEVRLTPPPAAAAAPPRPPAPAVAPLSRPGTPFGLGQV
jgi:hypothetical protein